ncbi:MAG: cation:proton antiporter [Cyanobacteria bacterium SZAS LIN-2]|nr:cation:proton antiporter [Cyanobacteria bacterium SZAS LIN-2]
MNEFALIRDLALIWTVALIAGYACIRLKQPVIAGYMLAGVIIGPHTLKLITQPDQIRMLSEFGVAMLLFALGVDLSLKQIMTSAHRILTAGISQMVFTVAAAWAIAAWSGLATSPAGGLLFGCICALSSSVVISRLLMDRGEADSIHGQILIPLSLVQDLSLVVIIPFLPVLQQVSQSSGGDMSAFFISAGKAAIFIAIVILGATKIMPPLLESVAKANSRELFLLTLLALCLSIALLSQTFGLSIALGAFLAGIMMSESTYAHQALHDVTPLRDVFSTIFFVSVGMLLDPAFMMQHWLQVAIFVVLLMIGKATIGTWAALFATRNLRSAILVGIGLSQIGEFSFILLTLGSDMKLISTAMYNLFFAGAVITMMATPALMAWAPVFLSRQLRAKKWQDTEEETISAATSNLQDHVVVCGYGRIGHNIGLVLEAHQIPFVVIELNANIIEELAMQGIRHIYGDSMNPLVLNRANIKQASSLVLTMPDPLSSTAVAAFARSQNAGLKIIARAHRTEEIAVFRAAGVNAVVQPEFEASIEITRLVLQSLNRPTAEVKYALDQIRIRRYDIFQPNINELDPAI